MDVAPNTPQIPNQPAPLEPEKSVIGPWRLFAIVLVVVSAIVLFGTSSAEAAWHQIAQLLSLQGKPEPVSANVLSEHEMEGLDQMSPQSQAELLLERSINHFRGANDQIAERVNSWRGQIGLNERLNNLFMTALNSLIADSKSPTCSAFTLRVLTARIVSENAGTERAAMPANVSIYRRSVVTLSVVTLRDFIDLLLR